MGKYSDGYISRSKARQECVATAAEQAGKMITGIMITDGHGWPDGCLVIEFADRALLLRDDGRSCCEKRFMSTDDNLLYFIGSQFRSIEVLDGPKRKNGKYGDVFEEQFLVVRTNLGSFTVVTHNRHNGYYGGFDPVAEFVGIDWNKEDWQATQSTGSDGKKRRR